tara:strand:- start:24542 stop:24883 length:342 start_codon:yes stop_codon:yes gene_type:complete
MDGAFQKTIALVALVILILGLILVAILLIVQANSQVFPPYSSTCPDYWDLDAKTGDKCMNIRNLGNTAIAGCKQLQPSYFTGSNADCDKLTYATHCNITWDGITNNGKLKKDC